MGNCQSCQQSSAAVTEPTRSKRSANVVTVTVTQDRNEKKEEQPPYHLEKEGGCVEHAEEKIHHSCSTTTAKESSSLSHTQEEQQQQDSSEEQHEQASSSSSTLRSSSNKTTPSDSSSPPSYLTHVEQAKAQLERFTLPLSRTDKVMVMQGWNKVLAFQTAFGEALVCHWRLLVAERYLKEQKQQQQQTTTTTTNNNNDTIANIPEMESDESDDDKGGRPPRRTKSFLFRNGFIRHSTTAMELLETNQDPIALALGVRLVQFPDLVLGLLDGALRSLCPHTQVVQREAYRPMADDAYLQRRENNNAGEEKSSLTMECETVHDYLGLLARCGVDAMDWVDFPESFAWALQTHTPYAQEDDQEDLERGVDSAFRKAVVQLVALPGIDAYADVRSLAYQELYAFHVKRFWDRHDETARLGVGEAFYRTLLTKYPQLMDYFSRTDMDALAAHLIMTVDLLIKSVDHLGKSTGALREGLNQLAKLHCRFRIATYNYMLVGSTLLEVLTPLFELEEKLTANDPKPVRADQLLGAFLRMYKEVMSIIYAPMIIQEKLLADAKEFYRQIQEEFHWSDGQYDRRMMEIEEEISLSGTYTQTSQELEMGARIAWRNSAKCIGRSSWNTLQVRDCRHISSPREMCEQVEEHLRIATAGTNIQSVMTVFAVKNPLAALGTRFWSAQYVRYAGYSQDDGSVLGDPANVGLTEYLIENHYWNPPENKTAFDVLPLVIKSPGTKTPFVHQLPSESVFEVDIEHPTNSAITALGYKWTTVPAISNFKMTLGGIVYQNIPFNGWFVSTEIVRNLMERYNAGPAIAKLLGIDTTMNESWRYAVAYELERSVLHSFRKNKFTIVDPHSVGESFCVHVRREREQHGRECPAQWSWIGGLVGPTNPTWHLEMRDFLVKPQYEYAMDGLAFHTALEDRDISTIADATEATFSIGESESFYASEFDIPKVLILYGSETGTAESVALDLKKQLKLLKPRLMTLDEAAGLAVVKKRRITHVLCVCSTFGEGGPPSNAGIFMKTPINKDVPLSTKFAVLALGSTLYPEFCQAGMELNKLLLSFGLEQFVDLVKADEVGRGTAAQAEWLNVVKRKLLPPYLEDALRPQIDVAWDSTCTDVLNWAPGDSVSSKSTGQGSLCIENAKLTDTVQKITFEVPEQSSYESGDHLVVYPVNCERQVDEFLACFSSELVAVASRSKEFNESSGSLYSDKNALEWAAAQPVSLETFEGDESEPADVFFDMPTTLSTVLKSQIDLATRESSFTSLLKLMKQRLDELLVSLKGEKASLVKVKSNPLVDEFLALEKDVCLGKQTMEDVIATFPNIVLFFSRFRSVFLDRFAETQLGREGAAPLISLADFLVLAPRLQPRFYSISSSNKISPNQVTITVGILSTMTSKGVPIKGVCSHYLASMKAGVDRARIGIRHSTFRLPNVANYPTSAPLIMVGAGTGLAPMMGFLQDRALDKRNGHEIGSIDLFFGCRDESCFIYEREIQQYQNDGLIRLHLALSRSKRAPKTYVQHKIEAMGAAGADLLLRKDTHYYVCGDARMANDCHEACVQLLRKHGRMSRVAAVHVLNKMRMEGRWQTDVWGIVSHFESSKKAARECRKAAAKIWLEQFHNNGNVD